MFKIDGANTALAMPARTPAGAQPGWFKQNPGAEPGTVVTGEYLNMLQAEILALLAAAGIAPNKDDDTQVLQAIRQVVSHPTGFRGAVIGLEAPAGWVLASGRTISKAGSGGTERANNDCAALFAYIWSQCPDLAIQTSAGGASVRGASALVDWDAGKRFFLPDYNGRAGFGRTNMGGVDTGRITVALSGVDGTKLGASGGTQARQFAMDFETQNANPTAGADNPSTPQPVIGTHKHRVLGSTDMASIMPPFTTETIIIKL